MHNRFFNYVESAIVSVCLWFCAMNGRIRNQVPSLLVCTIIFCSGLGEVSAADYNIFTIIYNIK